MRLEKPRILIVDDATENLDILMEALDQRYAVIAARNGRKAIEFARREPQPNLILLDIMMPDVDGYQVCQQLKADKLTQDIPIIFLTALTDPASELKGLELGAADYIHKPFSIPLVQARVAIHLELQQNRRQLAAQIQHLTEAEKLRESIDIILRHDLKAPLTPILGFSSYLTESTTLSNEQARTVQVIHDAALRMLDMINRSLDLYKMETGNYACKTSEVALASVLQKLIIDCSPQARDNHLNIQLRGPNISLRGEEILCYSLFGNLLRNAIQCAPQHTDITLNITADNNMVIVAINNQGAIPKAVQTHFFEKFNTTTPGGTGLGAYSARLMARTMGGDIDFDSSELGGTTLRVRLPRWATTE